jgi:hypothetical protein
MMFGQMQAVEAGLVGGGVEFDTFVVEGRQRLVADADVIKEADFHNA